MNLAVDRSIHDLENSQTRNIPDFNQNSTPVLILDASSTPSPGDDMSCQPFSRHSVDDGRRVLCTPFAGNRYVVSEHARATDGDMTCQWQLPGNRKVNIRVRQVIKEQTYLIPPELQPSCRFSRSAAPSRRTEICHVNVLMGRGRIARTTGGMFSTAVVPPFAGKRYVVSGLWMGGGGVWRGTGGTSVAISVYTLGVSNIKHTEPAHRKPIRRVKALGGHDQPCSDVVAGWE